MASQSPRFAPSAARLRPPLVDLGGRKRLQCRVAADIVATYFALPAGEIMAKQRANHAVAHGRHVAMYLAHVAFQLPLVTVASGFARDRTSVSYAIARIEDERDDEAFDHLLSRMEELAQSCRRLALPAIDDDGREG